MPGNIRVKDGEIFVGKALPWAAYDSSGRLLLQRGELISSRRQLEILLKRGLYRRAGEGTREDAVSAGQANPFELLADLRQRLTGLISAIALAQPEAEERARRLARDVQALCERDADAALGSIHLCRDPTYGVAHAVHSAILCELIGKRIGFQPARRESLLCAALTQNLGMIELLDRLRQQHSPDAAQQAVIDAHPQRSVDLLQAAGIADASWLEAVAQHHERLDGSGYPHRLVGDDIGAEARLLAVSDRYTAMVSERSYRPALSSKNALRHFFDDSTDHYDPQMRILLIKELGIYPPGAWVRLANGDLAMVIKRTVNATQPTVCALINARGAPYVRPMRRETADGRFRIEDVLAHRTAAFNLSAIWGYQ